MDNILLKQIKDQVDHLVKDTNAQLLMHDKKIAELYNYIKDNLSDSIKSLLETMHSSGELDEIITNTILTGYDEIYHKLSNVFSVKNFGAYGDGIHDDTISLQKAIDFCYKTKSDLLVPSGVYKTDTLIVKCNMIGVGNPIILFNENNRFQNFECDGSIRYEVKKLEGIIFESDKSDHYNMNCDVTDKSVIRKYGQRIFIGNKTTEPNNIYSAVREEMLNGTGWWNRDYSQWINSDNIDVDDVKTTYNTLENKTDTNMINAPYGIVIDKCKFIGFGVGLTIIGTYCSKIIDSEFARCKIGIVTTHAGMLPGKLNDSKSKVTTLIIENNLFADISYFGIYGDSLLQAKIYNNIFQPVGISVVLVAGADNSIYNNYNEIVHSGVLIATNDAVNNVIENNFANKLYSSYNTYVRYGLNNRIGKHTGNVKCYVAAPVVNSDFDENLELEKDNYFYTNGNAIARDKSKFAVFTTKGTGTGLEFDVKKSSRKDNSMPAVRVSQTGIEFNGTEEILSVELLQDYKNKGIITFYNIEGNGNPKVCYIEDWNEELKTFNRRDLREKDSVCSFRVSFNDGYKN